MAVSAKPIGAVLFEAVVVGILMIGFVHSTRWLVLPYIPDVSGHKDAIELFLIAGLLFHLVFEYTGINLWYSLSYCRLL